MAHYFLYRRYVLRSLGLILYIKLLLKVSDVENTKSLFTLTASNILNFKNEIIPCYISMVDLQHANIVYVFLLFFRYRLVPSANCQDHFCKKIKTLP